MTESQRRRLTEFLGMCWHETSWRKEVGLWVCDKCGRAFILMFPNQQFTTWNETMPLKDELVKIGEWKKFYWYIRDKHWSHMYAIPENVTYLFQSPEHFAALVADYLEVRK